MKYIRYVKLFLSLVFRDNHNERVSVKQAHKVSSLIWLN